MLNLEQIPSQGLSSYLCSRLYVVPTQESPQKNSWRNMGIFNGFHGNP